MANFHTHLGVGALASVGVAAAGFSTQLYGLTTALLCAIIGTLGSLLPDIDLEHSRPAAQGFLVVSLITSTLITILYANRYSGDELILHSLMVWAVGFLVLRFGVFETFSRLTTHRGMVHSIPYMAVFALAVVCGAFYGLHLTAFVSWLFGLVLFIGSMVHLLLDEIYSVDAFGLRLKQSFGTAIKLFEKDKLVQYACLYLVLGVLYYLAPPHQDLWRGLVRITRQLMS